jgi:hypothetical protein
MHSRFSFPYDGPPAQSVADRLLENATGIKLEALRTGRGSILVEVELTATFGEELFADEHKDATEIQKSNADALDFARGILGAFAATAGKDGESC